MNKKNPVNISKVKNRAPAEILITAEQLLREAKERDLEIVPPPPKQKISDPDELLDFQQRKRQKFEGDIRNNRGSIGNWIKYAKWEETQKEIQRARSVYERALDDHRNISLWLKYAEMEMRNKQVNHARNVWDRSVTILPRASQLWCKYTCMEEKLRNVAAARLVFERWMEWEPEEQAWLTYINFELRYKEIQRARAIYSRFVTIHPYVKNWIKYARFEENHSFINDAREVFERAVNFFGDILLDEHLFLAFGKFEERQKEYGRAKVIYKYGLDKIPREESRQLFQAYTIYEKKFGDKSTIESVVSSKRKFQYEQEIKNNPRDYDAWFDYIEILENEDNIEEIRSAYERAITNIPQTLEKRYWRRYIYLWIYYATFEELKCEDAMRARQVYKACLEIIPHKKFTFAKIWLLYANFEIRQHDLSRAKKILGTSIGMCPKNKLYKGYINLVIQLQDATSCRKLYEKFISFNRSNSATWIRFAELETFMGDTDRARQIYQLAIQEQNLDSPDVVWKAFIDFEIEQQAYVNVRNIYEALLEKTQHYKIWTSYCHFEISTDENDRVHRTRSLFQRANKFMKNLEDKEQRKMLLQTWHSFEKEHGDEKTIANVKNKLPKRKIKRIRYMTKDENEHWEEEPIYVFPEDETAKPFECTIYSKAKPNLKLFEKAKQWKEQGQKENTTD